MYNKKQIAALVTGTALIAGLSPITGYASNDQSVNVTIAAQQDGEFIVLPQEVSVPQNKAEDYGFTDSDDGVTYLDALVMMHEIKFGDEFTAQTADSYLAISSSGWITKTFGESGSSTSFFINSEMSASTADQTLINDGDKVESAFFMDTELYSDCYTAFIPEKATGVVGSPIQLDLFMHEWPMYDSYELEPIYDDYDFEAFTINTVNSDGSISEPLTDKNGDNIIPDENGVVTVSFDKPGSYIVTANGFIGEDYPVIAPFCIVTVRPQPVTATVTLDAQKDGAFLFNPQEVTVKSDTAEKYGFTDSDDGVTFLDALVKMHEIKYGSELTTENIADYLTTSYNAESDYYSITTAFGDTAWATSFFINNKMGDYTADKAILKDGDTAEYCFYSDTLAWSDCYTVFSENSIDAYVSEEINLQILKNSYDANWNATLLPIDGTNENNAITINTIESDGSISSAMKSNGNDICPDSEGNISLSFDTPGTYIITAQGIVDGYAPIFAPFCIVTVRPQPVTATVTLDAQKDGAFLFNPQEVTVKSDTAEKYGFTDSDDGVTFLDALVTMHEMKYGSELTTENIADYLTTSYNAESDYYSIATAFGDTAWATSFFINNKMGDYTAEKAILKDGDTAEYCFYSDTMSWSDCYTAFSENSIDAYVSEEINLQILKTSYDANWNATLLPIDGTNENNSITINTIESDGSISSAMKSNGNDICPDSEGNISLSFDTPGTYIITAQGIVDGYAPIFAPFCIINVQQYAISDLNVNEGKASVNVSKPDSAPDAVVILAVYDNNGVLRKTEFKAASNGTIEFNSDIDETDSVKAFIWNSLNSAKPFASAI